MELREEKEETDRLVAQWKREERMKRRKGGNRYDNSNKMKLRGEEKEETDMLVAWWTGEERKEKRKKRIIVVQ